MNYAREGNGPVLVEANTIRLLSHSTSDDQAKYRPKESLENDLANDPINKYVECVDIKKILMNHLVEEFKIRNK